MFQYLLVYWQKNRHRQQWEYSIWNKSPLLFWMLNCYLKKYRHATYTAMFLSGKLNGYLTKIDQQAEEMFFQFVMQMAEQESITEQLKADSQVEWIGRMNNIRQGAEEIVNAELIYS